MILIEFEGVRDDNEKNTIWINPEEISSIVVYQDRRAYGGYFEASKITLKNGKEFKVYGNAQNKFKNEKIVGNFRTFDVE